MNKMYYLMHNLNFLDSFLCADSEGNVVVRGVATHIIIAFEQNFLELDLPLFDLEVVYPRHFVLRETKEELFGFVDADVSPDGIFQVVKGFLLVQSRKKVVLVIFLEVVEGLVVRFKKLSDFGRCRASSAELARLHSKF